MAVPSSLLRRLHPRFRAWLRDVGMGDDLSFSAYYAEHEISSGAAARDLAQDLGLPETEVPKIQDDIRALATAAQARLRAIQAGFSRADSAVLYFRDKKRTYEETLERQWSLIERRELQEQRRQTPPPPVRPLYGSRLRKAEALEGDPQARQKAEEAERKKWMDKLLAGLRAVGAPSVEKAALSKHAAELLELQIGTKRAGTLRARVRSWSKYREWLQLAHGLNHPRDDFQFLDYVLDRRAEPSSRGTLSGIYDTLRFVERAMGLELGERVTEREYIKSAMRGILQATPTAVGRQRGPAQAPLTWCLIELERVVVSRERANYERMLAWWLLVSAWAVLRFDDHRGVETGGILATELGIDIMMSRTKTTGGDKSVGKRQGFVAWVAWLAESEWLDVGWKVWQTEAPWERDYLLVTPTPEGGCRARELRYGEYAGRMRRLLSSLTVGEFGAAGSHLAAYWQPHSWRAFLPSALMAIGAPVKTLNWLAAWKPQAGERYVRTQREQTRHMQIAVVRVIRAHLHGDDPLGEKANIAALRSHLHDRGVGDDDIGAIAQGLTCFPGAAVDQALWTQVTEGTCAGQLPEGDSVAVEPETTYDHDCDDFRPRWANGYVISISGNRRIRRLHKLGQCYRVPGVHYVRFEECGLELPSATLYNQYCKDCWRRDQPGSSSDPPRRSSSQSAGSTSSSSTSSGDSA